MSSSYSFLDVAVLDAVRRRFAAGDALVVLSADLERALWANGPGAALFGQPDIETFVGAGSVLPPVARRQLTATRGFPAIGVDRAITLRLVTGMTSQAVPMTASAIAMPDGEDAILLATPAASTDAGEIASLALGGFTDEGEFLAFIDGQGSVEAASDGFAALGIAQDTLAALVRQVAGQSDRTVKRLIAGGRRSYPAGMARLSDEPARHLLVVIDDGRAEDGQPEAPAASQVAANEQDDIPLPDEAAASRVEAVSGGDRNEIEPQSADADIPQDATTENEPGAEADKHEAPLPTADGDSETGTETSDSGQAPAIDTHAMPARFVWRTDADGAFSTISPEFAAVVGEQAADVIGRRFSDVATAFDLDPSGEIAQLLERRDTWSGRTVQWPAKGLRIPVDLAALPVYDRDRAFQGFRGFGVARPADAVVDTAPSSPQGMERLTAETAVGAVPTGQAAAAETTETDPFKGEVPALAIEPKPDRRFTDKVIRLAEHRPPTIDKSLSNVERNAFREIGERLRKDSGPSGEAASAPEAAGTGNGAPAGEDTPTARPARPELESEEQVRPADGVPAAVAQDETQTEAGNDDLRGPATEAGQLASGVAGAEPPVMADAEDAADEAEAAALEKPGEEIDAPPAPDGSAPDAPANDAVASGRPARKRSLSLLDYADPADGSPGALLPEETAKESERAQASADDSIAAADFADARDDETLPIIHDGEAGGAAGDAGNDIPAERIDQGHDKTPAAPQRARRPLSPPPLRSEGIMPSAFATVDDTAPDTSILARLPVPLLIHSGDALYYANDEFLDLTGYGALEGLVDAGGLEALFADPYADDGAADQTDRSLRLRTSEGREIPVHALLRTVPWRGGKALMLVLRRSGEEALEEPGATPRGQQAEMVQPDIADLKARISEMRTIIDTATDGVVLIDSDGLIRSISRPAEALFGFDGDDVAGKPFASLFAIESQRSANEYLASLSEPGVASLLNDGREVIGREAQGRFIPIFMTVGRLPGDSGYCAVVRDITQWKRAEEDLTQARAVAERASSQKTDFLARISHEIRTPLNAIIGFSELMVDEKFGPVANDRYRDYLRDINRSGNHVLDLVNDLLDISKIEAGQQEMDYEAVSLNDALAETVALMQPQANRERVIIRSSLASRLPDVVADLRSIRQIALNILSNAVRYTQAGGQVIVSTAYEPSGDVVMRVRDTGVGMTQAEIEQALKPFKQINALKRGRGDSTGLGLPLTKAMVEANRAQFAIHSTPGEGTLVEIAFPSTRVLAE